MASGPNAMPYRKSRFSAAQYSITRPGPEQPSGDLPRCPARRRTRVINPLVRQQHDGQRKRHLLRIEGAEVQADHQGRFPAAQQTALRANPRVAEECGHVEGETEHVVDKGRAVVEHAQAGVVGHRMRWPVRPATRRTRCAAQTGTPGTDWPAGSPASPHGREAGSIRSTGAEAGRRYSPIGRNAPRQGMNRSSNVRGRPQPPIDRHVHHVVGGELHPQAVPVEVEEIREYQQGERELSPADRLPTLCSDADGNRFFGHDLWRRD